ncbi:MAG: cytochrome C oxidase subunit IV family protein [Pirellulales bacterium]
MTGAHPSTKTYFVAYIVLLALLALTVAVAYIPLGAGNMLAALTIACIKAAVVVLYFMHVRYSSQLVRLSIGAGILCLAILIAFTLADYQTRGRIPTRLEDPPPLEMR